LNKEGFLVHLID
jgi:hypothetical protein